MVIYNADKVQADQMIVSVSLRNVSLTAALDAMLKDLPYTYTIEDQNVLIMPVPARSQQAPPARTTVAGKVTDANGHPLVGVAVAVRVENSVRVRPQGWTGDMPYRFGTER